MQLELGISQSPSPRLEQMEFEASFYTKPLEDLPWTIKAEAEIKRLALAHGQVSADDLRRVLSAPPHPNCIGAAFMAAAKRHLIRDSGQRIRSIFKPTHARRITVWLPVAVA